eukprot:gene10469-biopygen5070
MRLLEDQRKDVESVRNARGFMEGPLSLCIQHELLAILGTPQYISTQQDLGQFVLTVFGLGADLGELMFDEENTNKRKKCRALSLCGTVSDKLM